MKNYYDPEEETIKDITEATHNSNIKSIVYDTESRTWAIHYKYDVPPTEEITTDLLMDCIENI